MTCCQGVAGLSILSMNAYMSAVPDRQGVPTAFLSEPSGTVRFIEKDNTTRGDWQGAYGSYAHVFPGSPQRLLPIAVGNYTVPSSGQSFVQYGWKLNQIEGMRFWKSGPPYWDEYSSLSPYVNYTLSGTLYLHRGIWIQYPVFEWEWESALADPRGIVFSGSGNRRLTSWCDGSERGFPSRGYLNATLAFPSGVFLLSLYGYDMERVARSGQTVIVRSRSGVWDSAAMRGVEFDEGVYVKFVVYGPTEVVVSVVKDSDSTNAVLSGIFVDRVPVAEP